MRSPSQRQSKQLPRSTRVSNSASAMSTSEGVSFRHVLRAIRSRDVRSDYDFVVPLLAGDHVTDDAGTGFVHTAPGHGREDFELWTANDAQLSRARDRCAHPLHRRRKRRLHRRSARASRASGSSTTRAKGRRQRGGHRGADRRRARFSRAAGSSINTRIAGARRSPVIFRNTPQWFIAMDKPIANRPISGRADEAQRLRGPICRVPGTLRNRA